MWIAIAAIVLISGIALMIAINRKRNGVEKKESPVVTKKIKRVGERQKVKKYISGIQYISSSNRSTGKSFIRISQGSEPPAGTISIGDTIILEDAKDYTGTFKVNDTWVKDGQDRGIFILEKETTNQVRPGGKIYLEKEVEIVTV